MEIDESTIEAIICSLLDTIKFHKAVIESRDEKIKDLRMIVEMAEMGKCGKDN